MFTLLFNSTVLAFEPHTFKNRIADTAGQEEYEHIRAVAYPGTDVVLMAMNIMARVSMVNIENLWIVEKEKYMKKAKVKIQKYHNLTL